MERDPMSTPFYYLVGIVSWPFLRLLYRLRATGLENLPDGGFVLAANHVSNLDPWALGLPLWPKRRLRWMAKSELYNPLFKLILDHGGAFPVHRGQRDVEAVATAIELARAGDVVVMFPEGTRRRKGLRKRYEPKPHTGAARISIVAGVPLVPAAIRGTDRLSRLAQLRVAYGAPIPTDDLDLSDHSAAAQVATERLMREIARLEESIA